MHTCFHACTHTHRHVACGHAVTGASPHRAAATAFGVGLDVGQNKHIKRETICTRCRMEGFRLWLPARSGPTSILNNVDYFKLVSVSGSEGIQSETQQEQPITDPQQTDGDEIISARQHAECVSVWAWAACASVRLSTHICFLFHTDLRPFHV